MTFIKLHKIQFLIFSLAFLLFSNTLSFDYAWDDNIVITENAIVKKGFSGIPQLFIKSNSNYKSDKYGYRPVTLISFAIERQAGGDNAHVGHFFNVFYFALLSVLLFNVLSKVFSSYSNLLPFIATVIFIVHPIHCEVVANIKSRDEIFAFLFSLLSLNSMLNYTSTKQIKQLVYAVLFFVLAFLSKESAIVFLIIIPLTLLYKQGFMKIKKLMIPLVVSCGLIMICFAIVKLYMGSTVGVEQSKGAGIFHENGILGNSFFYTDVFTGRLANAFLLLILYLKNFFWPVKLVYFSGFNQIPVARWSDYSVLLSVAIHMGVLGYVIANFKKKPELFYAVCFYFISVSIYLHVFRTIADTMADRFYFVPSLAIIICVLFIIEQFFLKWIKSETFESFFMGKKHMPFKYACFLVLVLLSIKTFSRNKVWKNTETLFTNDMPHLQNCARAHQYYADLLQDKLQINFDANMEQQMINHYKKSIEICDKSYYSYLKLSMYYSKTNRLSEAVSLLNEMMKKFPEQADVYYYLGEVYYKLKVYDKSVMLLSDSKELAPDVMNTYLLLSLAQSKNKQFGEAINTITICEQKFGVSANSLDTKSELYFDNGNINESTQMALQLLNYGADPKQVYSKIIGRYQILKMDKDAAFYYKEARNKGVF
ncbi:MAG: glycosyltransferase family 39 protein [Bacteroidetes bacterium]|nr:glycosyltransferase family 39 protein [Bacteroidota bacterium]